MKSVEIKNIGFKFPDYGYPPGWPRGIFGYYMRTSVIGVIGVLVLTKGILESMTIMQFKLMWVMYWIYPLLWYWMSCFGLWVMFEEEKKQLHSENKNQQVPSLRA